MSRGKFMKLCAYWRIRSVLDFRLALVGSCKTSRLLGILNSLDDVVHLSGERVRTIAMFSFINAMLDPSLPFFSIFSISLSTFLSDSSDIFERRRAQARDVASPRNKDG